MHTHELRPHDISCGSPRLTAHTPPQDYNITFYCAEAVNTLTNLVFMWLGFKGLRNVFAHGHSSIFILIFLGYMVVGLGSMAFHTTLKCESSCLSSSSCVPLILLFSP